MLPGLLFLSPLLIIYIYMAIYAPLYPLAKPLEEWSAAYGRGILDEGPQLHAAYKACKYVGEVKVHEAKYMAVNDRNKNDGY